ncbi:C-GCAxxG-C-C family (seleno)protein [Clostridium chrysemydis]|uniref:C-GCAxxG-C-C family (seleno)protein n=1 Tax=Clostridium chrysemydis TaxID=2665504 RepID=UPI0018836404|nr:C-GCAxxG-C-C family (seleno)protein [Clostridium chrysemydis]
MSKVSKYNDEGYNCAESIIKGINEDKGLNIPISIGTPFGTGMSTGNTCGAVVGAMIALGAVKGREDSAEANNTRLDSKELINEVIEKYGSIKCIELKKNGVLCNDIIDFSYEKIKELIK